MECGITSFLASALLNKKGDNVQDVEMKPHAFGDQAVKPWSWEEE